MLRVKDQRRTKDEPRNDLRTPKRKKVLLLRFNYSGAIERTNGIAAKGVARNKKVDE